MWMLQSYIEGVKTSTGDTARDRPGRKRIQGRKGGEAGSGMRRDRREVQWIRKLNRNM